MLKRAFDVVVSGAGLIVFVADRVAHRRRDQAR